jgi:tRNA (adenine57-N1/adenine58-N1)-methyltransferase
MTNNFPEEYQDFDRAQPGELALFISPTNKTFIIKLSPGLEYHTHRGILMIDDIIGQPWGSQVFTHNGNKYHLVRPGLTDILLDTTRNTQIMYPKDIGFILITMGIGPGVQVLEAGTGSGAFTTALAWAVGDEGHVYSYDVKEAIQKLAFKNLARLDLVNRVTLKNRDIQEGFDEKGMDAVFLDLQNAYDYVAQAGSALKLGGFLGCILPTTNQVSMMINALRQNFFGYVDVCEIILRYYKPVSERLRPTDRMVAHTGYLVFSRKMLPSYLTEAE